MSSAITQTRSTSEARMSQEGQQNAGGISRTDDEGRPFYDSAPLSEYPRMMYRATKEEQTQEWADAIAELKDKPMVINRFNGLLCDTIIANSATDAETLTADGWDISPQAAHGVSDGLAKVATAKDDEIAALKAQLAAMQQPAIDAGEPDAKRGPGRPRLTPAT